MNIIKYHFGFEYGLFKKKLRYFLGSVFGYLTFHLSCNLKKSMKSNHIRSVYFHKPSPFLFEKFVKIMLKNSFKFISAERLEEILVKKMPIDAKYLVITIDDGWRENLKLLSIIEKYQVYITLFISTEPIITGNFWWEYVEYSNKNNSTKYIDKKALKRINNQKRLEIISDLKSRFQLKKSALSLEELVEFSKSRYITIGSHTITHPITIMCNDKELEEEYSGSKMMLEKWLGREIKYFAYPNGDYNAKDIFFLKKFNYKMAFCIKNELIDNCTDFFQIPRFGMNDDGNFFENRAKLFGIWQKFFSKKTKVNKGNLE